MKLYFKIASGIAGAGVVGGLAAAFVVANKTDTIDVGGVNKKNYDVKGYTKNDLEERKNRIEKIESVSLFEAEAKTNFDLLLTNLGFDQNDNYKNLDLAKLKIAFNSSNIKYSDKYGTTAKVFFGNDGPYFLASFGNKYKDLTNLAKSITELSNKPTYKEFIELFNEAYSVRDYANKIMKLYLKDVPEEYFISDYKKFSKINSENKESTSTKNESNGEIVDIPKSNPALDNSKEMSKAISGKPVDSVEKIRMGVWNVLNYNTDLNETDLKVKYKTKSLAKIILDAKEDLLGLTEIEGRDSLKALVAELNHQSGSSFYKYIRSQESGSFNDGTLVGSSGQYEYYGFIYNSTKVKPIPFEATTEVGAIYTNPKMDNELISGEKTGYVRPPFGVKFMDNNNHDFTVAVGHFDSPGNGKEKGNILEQSYKLGQGTQEVWEATHLTDVAKYFDSIDGKNDDMIIMGDTNIKMDMKKDSASPFNPLIKMGFKSLSDPTLDANKTSLGTSKTDDQYHYANPYDRIFVKSDMLDSNMEQKRYEILNPEKMKVFFNYDEDSNSIDEKYINQQTKKLTLNGIRYRVSDHTNVYFDLNTSQKDTDIENNESWRDYLKSNRDYNFENNSTTPSNPDVSGDNSNQNGVTKFTFSQFIDEAKKGPNDLKEFLLNHGATNVNGKPFEISYTALNYAKKAADQNPLDWADFANKYAEIKKYSGDELNDGTFTGNTASRFNNIVDMLTTGNAPVNPETPADNSNQNGVTKFTFSQFIDEAKKGPNDLKEFLLNHGATNVNGKPFEISYTALNYAKKAADQNPLDWADFANKYAEIKKYSGDELNDGTFTGNTASRFNNIVDMLTN
ncbi:MAG: endonuclease/exonuclease/phosphatase family protein [Mycoplasmatales bacterium]|nr:endonuclease/exonuclease/phosphatase family protein [Mycoplasmatales bacterium]